MRSLSVDRTLWPSVAGLAGVFLLFETTGLDLWVQDAFFDFSSGRWLIDREEPVLRALLYTGPKVVIVFLGLALLGALVRPPLRLARRDLAVALLCLATIPALIGWGKARTNVFCPWDITRYGGDVPYVRVLERFPPDQRPVRRGGGFPAGHASGGFALFGLAGLAHTRRGQWALASIGLAAGATMGVYQMAKGAHYLSHTLVTALVAWIMFLVWRRLLRADQAEPADASP
jgi:membrane-associated PAP2 superfamily phosphatase